MVEWDKGNQESTSYKAVLIHSRGYSSRVFSELLRDEILYVSDHRLGSYPFPEDMQLPSSVDGALVEGSWTAPRCSFIYQLSETFTRIIHSFGVNLSQIISNIFRVGKHKVCFTTDYLFVNLLVYNDMMHIVSIFLHDSVYSSKRSGRYLGAWYKTRTTLLLLQNGKVITSYEVLLWIEVYTFYLNMVR